MGTWTRERVLHPPHTHWPCTRPASNRTRPSGTSDTQHRRCRTHRRTGTRTLKPSHPRSTPLNRIHVHDDPGVSFSCSDIVVFHRSDGTKGNSANMLPSVGVHSQIPQRPQKSTASGSEHDPPRSRSPSITCISSSVSSKSNTSIFARIRSACTDFGNGSTLCCNAHRTHT
ncbi:hypothetical protein DSM100238_1132 [Bifidobacterium apri]|uniref:Uncharacterized protein n=1 Tax=Bifidobacterium apri TaxID=1769423 RepID=A0A6A2W1M6_9BIFI|nr:hypothetical protein DSM100238_1132 [Bifidobacterium apri]